MGRSQKPGRNEKTPQLNPDIIIWAHGPSASPSQCRFCVDFYNDFALVLAIQTSVRIVSDGHGPSTGALKNGMPVSLKWTPRPPNGRHGPSTGLPRAFHGPSQRPGSKIDFDVICSGWPEQPWKALYQGTGLPRAFHGPAASPTFLIQLRMESII